VYCPYVKVDAVRSRSLVQMTISFTATWRIPNVEKVQSYCDNFADYNDKIKKFTT